MRNVSFITAILLLALFCILLLSGCGGINQDLTESRTVNGRMLEFMNNNLD